MRFNLHKIIKIAIKKFFSSTAYLNQHRCRLKSLILDKNFAARIYSRIFLFYSFRFSILNSNESKLSQIWIRLFILAKFSWYLSNLHSCMVAFWKVCRRVLAEKKIFLCCTNISRQIISLSKIQLWFCKYPLFSGDVHIHCKLYRVIILN